MLARQYRLDKGENFSKSKIFNNPLFTLKIKAKKEEKKFGFVVSKKIDKRAVVRNELKRKIRSCIENRLNDIRNGNIFLFILKKEALKTEKKRNLSGDF